MVVVSHSLRRIDELSAVTDLFRTLPNKILQPSRAEVIATQSEILETHHVKKNHSAHPLQIALLDKLCDVSATSISMIRQRVLRIGGIRIVALFPIEAEGFFAIKENKPIRHAGLRLVRSHHARKFQERARRSATIVGANKLKVFEILSVVMTRDDDHVV